MKQNELKKDTWYSLYPYKDSNKDCEWWMKDNGKQRGQASVFISWHNINGARQFHLQEGNLGGYDYREATPKEAAWLAEVEKLGGYFPITEFKSEEVINDYSIY